MISIALVTAVSASLLSSTRSDSVVPVDAALSKYSPFCVPDDDVFVSTYVRLFAVVVPVKAWLTLKSESLSRLIVTSSVEPGVNVLFPVNVNPYA